MDYLSTQLVGQYYMECHGDLVRHSLLKYWDEVGTKLAQSLTIAVRICRNLYEIQSRSNQIYTLYD